MKNLFAASHQWATRPDDERFWTLQEMHQACLEHRQLSREREISLADLRVEADGQDVQIVGRKNQPAHFSNYSFGQLCNRVGAPASFLRELPPTLAAQVLNNRIRERFTPEDRSNILLRMNGTWHVQALTSHIYERIWNHQVVEFLLSLPGGWRVPPARPATLGRTRPATAEDVFASSLIQLGDPIAPAGLYASDHDMFAFLVNEGLQLEAAPGGRETLSRGFFIRNSEVAAFDREGNSSLSLTMFYYEYVCGNHIVWGARDVVTFSLRHVGQRARSFQQELSRGAALVSNASMEQDRQRIQAARVKLLGTTQLEVVDFVADRIRAMSRKRAEEVYQTATRYSDVHGDPRTVWGFVSGATRQSQQTPYSDERYELDRAASRILNVAFEEVK